jgi:hypothetical protein
MECRIFSPKKRYLFEEEKQLATAKQKKNVSLLASLLFFFLNKILMERKIKYCLIANAKRYF